ncbi:MAG: hypothetical protein WKF36_10955 [Candidatus Nitrosocosmicus sp.]
MPSKRINSFEADIVLSEKKHRLISQMGLATGYKHYPHQIKQVSTSTNLDVTNNPTSNNGQKENTVE